jgi:hypothetical protein
VYVEPREGLTVLTEQSCQSGFLEGGSLEHKIGIETIYTKYEGPAELPAKLQGSNIPVDRDLFASGSYIMLTIHETMMLKLTGGARVVCYSSASIYC